MLSILIPTYQYDCTQLVSDLREQCEALKATSSNFDYEILVREGVGRAHQRNMLAAESKGDFLLFIDADAKVVKPDFVATYWQSAMPSDVVAGGLLTPSTAPRGHELRLRYEQAADKHRTVALRQAEPYACFTTFNFLVRREVFEAIRFDEQCTEYGYEDALFGVELQRHGFSIQHIDNPLMHMGINDNASFLEASGTALRTLRHLGRPMTDHARVSLASRQLKRWHLRGVYTCLFRVFRPLLRMQLLSSHPSLLLFSAYKLGYYCTLKKTP